MVRPMRIVVWECGYRERLSTRVSAPVSPVRPVASIHTPQRSVSLLMFACHVNSLPASMGEKMRIVQWEIIPPRARGLSDLGSRGPYASRALYWY